MKTALAFILIITLLTDSDSIAQAALSGSSIKWTSYNCKADISGDTIHLINPSGKTAFLWANKDNFKNGIIELDIKGNDKRGESFVGITFHALDHEMYDAVYFRPFNFRDNERKDRAVQYVSKPNYDWDLLREKHPGKYEHAILPDTDPNNWFHVKIVVQHPNVKVYVNGSEKPTLEVAQLSERKNGLFGLWIDSPDGWFKNITVTNSK
jgi:hypothetical protein